MVSQCGKREGEAEARLQDKCRSESAVGSRDLPSLHCCDLVQLNRKPREPVVELSLLRQRPGPGCQNSAFSRGQYLAVE